LFLSFHSKRLGCLRSKSVSRPFQHRRIGLKLLFKQEKDFCITL
jgi:hypothetical protein